MTAIAMNYVVNPMTGFFSKLGHWIVRTGEIAGTSRAASELARQGYHAEAKALMLQLDKLRKQIG